MASWLEGDARREAIIYSHGPDVWRNLKLSLEQEVAAYIRIYGEDGKEAIRYTDCRPISEDCFRVSFPTPLRKPDTSFEIRFSLEEKRIACLDINVKFTLAVENDNVILQDKDGNTVSIEDASRAILSPLFAKLPHRKPNITL